MQHAAGEQGQTADTKARRKASIHLAAASVAQTSPSQRAPNGKLHGSTPGSGSAGYTLAQALRRSAGGEVGGSSGPLSWLHGVRVTCAATGPCRSCESLRSQRLTGTLLIWNPRPRRREPGAQAKQAKQACLPQVGDSRLHHAHGCRTDTTHAADLTPLMRLVSALQDRPGPASRTPGT